MPTLSSATASLLLAFLLWGVAPGEALAFPIKFGKNQQLRLDFASTSVFEYHTRNFPSERSGHAPQYMDLRNKIDVNLRYKGYTLGGRFDTINFFQDRTPCPASFPRCKAAYIPEKLYLKLREGYFDATLGDFYVTFGRGLSLSIRKVDEFGLDTTLRGGRASFNNGVFQVTVVGGLVNNNNFDPVEEAILKDTNDFIFGSQVTHRFAKIFELGGHYVFLRPAPKVDPAADDKSTAPIEFTHIIGGSMQFNRIQKKVDLYFEGNAMIRQLFDEETLGYAFYAGFNGYFFPVTVRVEGSWYRNYLLQGQPQTNYTQASVNDPPEIPTTPFLYNNPPTMDREDLDGYGETSDVRGLRIRLDYTYPNRKAIIYINYMFRAGFPPAEGVEPMYIHHVFAGTEIRGGKYDITGSIGWREVMNLPNWQTFHVDGDVSFQFQPKQSMEIAVKFQYHNKDKYQYSIFDFQLGYAYAKIFTIAFLLSYSNEIKDAPFIPNWNKNFFVGGLAKFEFFGYGSIKVSYGRTRGGLRCLSGVCRTFPAFEGFQTELNLRF